MKELMLVATVVGLATTGCAQTRLLGNRDCRGQACHVTRSQVAPRPDIVRTACHQGDCSCDQLGAECGIADDCCAEEGGCDDACCDSGGCDEAGCGIVGGIASGFCPEPACGYPESYNNYTPPRTGQVAYPYYTVRGPRDFLNPNPPSIGPY